MKTTSCYIYSICLYKKLHDHAHLLQLRNQAETELRALRAELMQKKINLTLSRNSHLTTYAPPAADVNFMTARSGITPRS